MARDAALLHTSDGQLEAALTLFVTSIEAFLRVRCRGAADRSRWPACRRCSSGSTGRRSPAPCSAPWLSSRPASITSRPWPSSASGSAPGSARRRRPRARHRRRRHGPPRRRGVRPPPDRRGLARRSSAAGHRGGPAGLTARETQVLRLIADGASTREISERLFISAKTADNHIQHIYTKLGVTNRAAATRWALDHGLVVEPTDRAEPRVVARNRDPE